MRFRYKYYSPLRYVSISFNVYQVFRAGLMYVRALKKDSGTVFGRLDPHLFYMDWLVLFSSLYHIIMFWLVIYLHENEIQSV